MQVLGLLQSLVGRPNFRQLRHFSGRRICGRTLTLSYPIIKVSGRVVDPKVTVLYDTYFFNVGFLCNLSSFSISHSSMWRSSLE